jgi:hypothetical protein
MTYKSAINLEECDVSWLYENQNCGKTTMVLRDFTANGENFNDPHPSFLRRFADNPYWVIITDEDDYITQKEFSSLQEAYKFFYRFLIDKEQCLREMDY